MALFGASFQIGRSALAAYQAALSVAGQNIANVGNPDYARQTGRLSALVGGPVLGGVAPGGGVQLSQLRRHVDEALEARLRSAGGQLASSDVVFQYLSQTESLYNELTDQDVSTQLGELFGAFGQLQTAPQETNLRNLTVSSADALISSIRRQRAGLLQQVRDLNDEAIAAASRATDLSEQIASLNEMVVAAEADGVTIAGALRDRRDALLRELSTIMDVQVREQENGSINVYVGSEPLIEFNRPRGIVIETVLQDGLELSQVRFADNRGSVIVRGGRLAGILQARDGHIGEQLDRLDQLARGLIYEVNRVHSTGVGLVGYEQITSNYAVDDPDAALSSTAANLPFPVQNGSIEVKVRDRQTGQVITRLVEVDLDGLNDDDTTLNTLAADLDALPGISASVTADNRLQITADPGQEFWFSSDSAGALAATGVASFFDGVDASTIDVDEQIRADVRRVATSLTGELNDGTVAGRVARLNSSSMTSSLLGNQSIGDFHASTISTLAVKASAALTEYEAADAVNAALYAQREATSGVSLDEEAINLTKYEMAYQGAARYVGVLQGMTAELLALVR